MTNVTVIELPRSRNMATLERVKRAMNISDTESDERLSDLIADVSSAVVEHCGYEFARSLVTESLEGYGDTTLSLERTPIIRVDELRFCESVISPSGYDIVDAAAGLLYRRERFDSTQPIQQWLTASRVNMKGAQDWQVDYMGGFLMPEDDFSASGICSVLADDQSFNLTSADRWPLLVSGERISIDGFNEEENNGTFIVISRTDQKLIVSSSLVTESASGAVDVIVSLIGNTVLPRDLQRMVLAEIKDRFLSEERDSQLTSEKIGDWAATYAGRLQSESSSDDSGFSAKTAAALRRYQRVAL